MSAQFLNHAAPTVGDSPPALQLDQIFQGPTLDKVTWENLKGKVVVLEFWNTACAPCVQVIPHLNDLVHQFRDQPVVFLSVSDDNPDHLKRFLRKRPIESWLGIDHALSPTKQAFGVTGIPETFLIDRLGKIAAITGPAHLEPRHLQELLDGKPSSLPPPKAEDRRIPRMTSTEAMLTNEPPREITVSLQGPFPLPDHGAFNFREWNESHTVFRARHALLKTALASFFGVSEKRVISETRLTGNLYDISAAAPTANDLPKLQEQFVAMLATNLGLHVLLANRELEVYTMTRITTNAPQLRSATDRAGGGEVAGGFVLHSSSMDGIASFFENYFDQPVINETGAAGLWAADIKWKMSDSELLEDNLDASVWSLVQTNPAAIIAGNLPPECRDKITPDDLKLLQSELAKPDDRQFQPAVANIITAALDQLGLEIKPAKRTLPVVLVGPIN